MRKIVVSHFKKHDPVLFSAYQKLSIEISMIGREPNEYFVSLCREIVGQQLSSKASAAIFAKFTTLFPNGVVTPEEILTVSDQRLRSSGISFAKVSFVKDLAEKVHNGTLNLETLKTLSEEKIIEQLTTVKGIGPWTAEMFLIFALGKEDVFSYRDLGLRKGLQKLYSLSTLPSKEECLKLTLKWSPYRSFGSLLLWKILDV